MQVAGLLTGKVMAANAALIPEDAVGDTEEVQ